MKLLPRIKSVGLVVAFALLLSGCTSSGVGEDAIPEGSFIVQRDADFIGEVANFEERVVIVDKTTILVHVGGSSSCPPIIETVSYDETIGRVNLMMKEYGAVACTSDFGMLPQRVTAIVVGFDFNQYDIFKCKANNCSVLPFAEA